MKFRGVFSIIASIFLIQIGFFLIPYVWGYFMRLTDANLVVGIIFLTILVYSVPYFGGWYHVKALERFLGEKV